MNLCIDKIEFQINIIFIQSIQLETILFDVFIFLIKNMNL